MKSFLSYLYERLNFPKEHSDTFLAAYDVLSQNEDFCRLVDNFYIDTEMPLSEIDERLAEIIEPCDFHLYTGKFVFYCCLAKELPRTNSLWRAYAERLCAGGDVGSGSGIFVWDDVNKITVK